MTLSEITDQVFRLVEGGVSSDDSKLSRRAVEALVPKWRSKAILIAYNGSREVAANKFLNPDLYQKETLTFDAADQVDGADFIVFYGASPIQLNDSANGVVFIGDRESGQPFTQLKGPGAYGMAKDAGLIDQNAVYVEITGDEHKVWGNTGLRTMFKNFIASDPKEVADFDAQADKYPVSQDVLDIMLRLAVIELTTPANRPGDIADDGRPIPR